MMAEIVVGKIRQNLILMENAMIYFITKLTFFRITINVHRRRMIEFYKIRI